MTSGNNLKVVIVGEFKYSFYEPQLYMTLTCAGIDAKIFSLENYFASSKLKKFEKYLKIFGFASYKLQKDLINFVRNNNITHIFLWRRESIHPRIIKELRKFGVILSYNNDSPFAEFYYKTSNVYSRRLWSWYLKGLSYTDYVYFYRQADVKSYKEIFGGESKVVMPGYDPSYLKFQYSIDEAATIKGVFVGHYENDGRSQLISYINACGLTLDVYGPGWRSNKGLKLNYVKSGSAVFGDDYIRLLLNYSYALCIFSGKNRDKYTRRLFEICSLGVPLLCEKNDFTESFFTDMVDAILFESYEEAVLKIRTMSPRILREIGSAGRQLVIIKKCSYYERFSGVVDDIKYSCKIQNHGLPLGVSSRLL